MRTVPPIFLNLTALAVTSPDRRHDAAFLGSVARRLVRDELARVGGVVEVRVVGPATPGCGSGSTRASWRPGG